MSVLAYNLTTSPLTLAAGAPAPVLPASGSAGSRGSAVNVTGELKSLTSPSFALIQAQVAAKQCVFEWSGLPEFNTFSLVVGSAQEDVEDLPTDLYADSSTGSDDNDGTLALPYQTFGKVMSRLAADYRGSPVNVHLAAGSYPPPANAPTFYHLGTALGLMDVASVSPGSFSSVKVFGELAAVASAVAATSVGNVVTAPLVSVDRDFDGALLVFSDGTRREVGKSTFAAGTTTFELVTFAGPGVIGLSFDISRPASIIQCPDDFAIRFFAPGGMYFNDVKFAPQFDTGSSFPPMISFDGNSVFDFGYVEIDGGTASFRQIEVARGTLLNLGTFSGEGLYLHNCNSMFFENGTGANGNVVMTLAALQGGQSPTGPADLMLRALYGFNSDVFLFERSTFEVNRILKMDGTLYGVDTINCFQRVCCLLVGFIEQDISNSTGSAVGLDTQCSLVVGDISSSGNAGYGVKAIHGGNDIAINDGGTATALTGALGDFLLEVEPTSILTPAGIVPAVAIDYALVNAADANGVKGATDIYGNRVSSQ